MKTRIRPLLSLFFVTLLTIAMLSGNVEAIWARYSGAELLELCKNRNETLDQATCTGYVGGIYDALELQGIICTRERPALSQLQQVAVNYIQSHPEELFWESSILVRDALIQAFLCTKH